MAGRGEGWLGGSLGRLFALNYMEDSISAVSVDAHDCFGIEQPGGNPAQCQLLADSACAELMAYICYHQVHSRLGRPPQPEIHPGALADGLKTLPSFSCSTSSKLPNLCGTKTICGADTILRGHAVSWHP